MQQMKSRTVININEKAEKEGIGMPVKIDPTLLKNLTPSPFLLSLGVSLEHRIDNLLSLVKANLTMKGETEKPSEDRYYIPFIVLKGPLVKEDFLSIIVTVKKDDGEKSIIHMTQAIDPDNEIL
ncbi:hypothetical protein [Treponema primitia]|uniref:hypothetical protein n=1 Tax=Treponema primitia TaxID=88058 RepID=UPI0002555878|nr:hypothetical protein [Treponema primitia]